MPPQVTFASTHGCHHGVDIDACEEERARDGKSDASSATDGELQATLDVILQETFTLQGRGRTSPLGHSSLLLQHASSHSLLRPPHVTLLWQQQLDGQPYYPCGDGDARLGGVGTDGSGAGRGGLSGENEGKVRSLLGRMRSGHQQTWTDEPYDAGRMQRAVREEHIGRLLVVLTGATAPSLAQSYLRNGAVDKVVLVVHPQMMLSSISASMGAAGESLPSPPPLPFKNLHFEQLDGQSDTVADVNPSVAPLVITCEPCYRHSSSIPS